MKTDLRPAILASVRANPGRGFSSILRRAGLSVGGKPRRVLQQLGVEGQVRIEKIGGSYYIYPAGKK